MGDAPFCAVCGPLRGPGPGRHIARGVERKKKAAENRAVHVGERLMVERGEAVAAALNAFRRILQAMRVASTDVQQRTGLSAAQLFVLHFLEDGRSLSINELSEFTMTDRSSVAEAVQRLAQRRLVKRAWSSEDRRRAAVTITALGRRALERAPEVPAVWLVNGIERLSEPELEALAHGLERLTIELGIEHEQPVMLFDVERVPPRTRRRATTSGKSQRGKNRG